MLKLFRSYHQLSYLWVFFYALIVNVNLFISPIEPHLIADSWGVSGEILVFVYLPYVVAALFVLFTYATAIYINRLLNEYKLLNRPTALPALAMILLTALGNEYLALSWSTPAILMLALALSQIFLSYKNKSAIYLFNVGFWIGCSMLFYPPSIIFIVPLFIFNIGTRIFSFREWGISILGVVAVIYVSEALAFLVGNLGSLNQHLFSDSLWGVGFPPFDDLERMVKTGVLLLIFLNALVMLQTHFSKTSIKNRKFLGVLIWYFVAGLASFVVLGTDFSGNFSLLVLPASVFLAFIWMERKSVFITEFIHVILLVILILFQYVLK